MTIYFVIGVTTITILRQLAEIRSRRSSMGPDDLLLIVNRQRMMWDSVFATASTATPMFLGASAGAIASGRLAIAVDGEYDADYLTGDVAAGGLHRVPFRG